MSSEAQREASRRWRESHPEAVKEQKRLYYQRSYERLKDVRNIRNKLYKRELRERAHAALGGVCVKCKFSDWRALQIDHREGGGRDDRARFANRDQFLREVIAFPEKYQLLCSNCNWIKRHELNENSPGRPRAEDIEDQDGCSDDLSEFEEQTED